MIRTIEGRKGSGKTLLAVYFAKQAIDAGQPVWANFYVKGAQQFTRLFRLRKLQRSPSCLIVFDVANTWGFTIARNIHQPSRDLLKSLNDFHDLIFVFQHLPETSSIFSSDFPITERCTTSIHKDCVTVVSSLGDSWNFNAAPLYPLYNTFEQIARRPELPPKEVPE